MNRFSNATLVLSLAVLVLAFSLALIASVTFMVKHLLLPQLAFPTIS